MRIISIVYWIFRLPRVYTVRSGKHLQSKRSPLRFHFRLPLSERLLLVDLEFVPSLFQIGYYLLGCGNTCVEVGLGSLGTHLFGSEEYAVGEFLLELFSLSGFDVADIADVGTLLESTDETLFVDNLFTGGVCLLYTSPSPRD